jgi:hypothetical protein
MYAHDMNANLLYNALFTFDVLLSLQGGTKKPLKPVNSNQ